MQELRLIQTKLVNGGHNTSNLAMAVIGIPHVIVGVVEFYNYFYDWYLTGCETIEDGDHFKEGVCGLVKGG